MSEPNPYEPPREPEPLTREKVVKRSMAVAAIILLTPPAMAVAVAGSCTVAQVLRTDFPMMLILGAPLVVLTGLMVWASALDRRRKDDPNRQVSRASTLLATPVIVAGGYIVGYGIALLAVFVVGETFHDLGRGLIAGMIAFWFPPAIALLAMLRLAWRTG